MTEAIDKKKRIIGLYGEMRLAMELHAKGWQVHRSYIDEGIDFIITKYWCTHCRKFVNQHISEKSYKSEIRKCVTNKCDKCKEKELEIKVRYLQVKTSEGIAEKNNTDTKKFSFHPKIRYIMRDVFYVWIAVFKDGGSPTTTTKDDDSPTTTTTVHYYVFRTGDIIRFDDINIKSYQITDNQKTSLRIDRDGDVRNQGNKYNYDCFKEFHNNFSELDTDASPIS
ncbi:hypothetical protein COTS27_00163 [Spirochaetota bacterium]|nr:hypothetical protein COTS27_00163 [Spirochaetota bacterium]